MRRFPACFCVVALLCGSPALAMQFSSGDRLQLDQSESISEDWYAAGVVVNVYGTLRQDALIAASELHFWGVVERDLQAVALEAEISGRIAGNLRVVGKKINVAAKISGSALAVGESVVIGEKSLIQGELVALGKELEMDGMVNGPVRLTGKKILVRGMVMGDVFLDADEIVLGSNARILGRLSYASPHPLRAGPGALVGGPVDWKNRAALKNVPPGFESIPRAWSWIGWAFRLTFLTVLFFFGAFFLLLAPGVGVRATVAFQRRFWSSLGLGLLTLALSVVVGIIFFVTLIGIPVAVLVAVFLTAALLAGRLAVGYWIGRLLVRPRSDSRGIRLLAFALGFVLLAALGEIPVAGPWIHFLTACLGLGGLWLMPKSESKPATAETGPVLPPAAGDPLALKSVKPESAASALSSLETPQPTLAKSESFRDWEPPTPAFKRKPRSPKADPGAGKKTGRAGKAVKSSRGKRV